MRPRTTRRDRLQAGGDGGNDPKLRLNSTKLGADRPDAAARQHGRHAPEAIDDEDDLQIAVEASRNASSSSKRRGRFSSFL